MIQELYDYDLFPKVVLAGRETELTLRGLGSHAGIVPGNTYSVCISAVEQGHPGDYPAWADVNTLELLADEYSALHFTYTFQSEQEYYVRLSFPESNRSVLLSLYALDSDMKGRYPYRGDLHVHSNCSDGREAPEIVCAAYRKAGYDFMPITDHRLYYPSLQVIRKLSGLIPSFTLLPGEEVHLPLTDIHIINFGGEYSINALVDGNQNQKEHGDDPSVRSLNGSCPPVLSRKAYEAQIEELAAQKPFGTAAEDKSFAVCEWAFDRIREAKGLGIFCHPYWRIRYGNQVPERFVDRMLEEHPFDAFEVLGGENYYEQNGFQTAKYYELKAKGISFPIVGSTDTHGCTEHYENALICSTVVFAPCNERTALISSIKEEYCVAVDTISKQYRLVGSLRLQKYTAFLMKHFYPLHDELCRIDGAFLRRYVLGEQAVIGHLNAVKDDMKALYGKYFAL